MSEIVSDQIRQLHADVRVWQGLRGGRLPNQHSDDSQEARLGVRLTKALLRRSKALGPDPSERLLTTPETALINSIPSVPEDGCAVTAPRGTAATRAETVLMNVANAVQEMNAETRMFLDAMRSDDLDEVVSVLDFHTGMENSNRAIVCWEHFCSHHAMNGDRFRHLLEPLLDLTLPFIRADGTPMTLRQFGDDNIVLKVEFLLSAPPHREAAPLWVACAIFLARHAGCAVPTFMQAPGFLMP